VLLNDAVKNEYFSLSASSILNFLRPFMLSSFVFIALFILFSLRVWLANHTLVIAAMRSGLRVQYPVLPSPGGRGFS
jgi:hypothetical protein